MKKGKLRKAVNDTKSKINKYLEPRLINPKTRQYPILWTTFVVAFGLRFVFLILFSILLTSEINAPGMTTLGQTTLFLALAATAHTVAQIPGIIIDHQRTPLQKVLYTFADFSLYSFFATFIATVTPQFIDELPKAIWSYHNFITAISIIFFILLAFTFALIFHPSRLALEYTRTKYHD